MKISVKILKGIHMESTSDPWGISNLTLKDKFFIFINSFNKYRGSLLYVRHWKTHQSTWSFHSWGVGKMVSRSDLFFLDKSLSSPLFSLFIASINFIFITLNYQGWNVSLFPNKETKSVGGNRIQTFPEVSENCKMRKGYVREKISLVMVNKRIKWSWFLWEESSIRQKSSGLTISHEELGDDYM